jgi:hypothetical protein
MDHSLQVTWREFRAEGSPTAHAAYLQACLRSGLLEERLVNVAAYCGHPAAGILVPNLGGPWMAQHQGMRLCRDCAQWGPPHGEPWDQVGVHWGCGQRVESFAGDVQALAGAQGMFALALCKLVDGSPSAFTRSTATRGARRGEKESLDLCVEWLQTGLPNPFPDLPLPEVRRDLNIERFAGAARRYLQWRRREAPAWPEHGDEWIKLLKLSLRGADCAKVDTWAAWLTSWALAGVEDGPNTDRTKGPLPELDVGGENG